MFSKKNLKLFSRRGAHHSKEYICDQWVGQRLRLSSLFWVCFLVERDSKMQAFFLFFRRSSPNGRPWSQVFLAETVETGDKNRDDFLGIKISLVMSMRFIFGDDWNGACKLIMFLAVWQWCNLSRFEALDFRVIMHACVLKSKYLDEELL